MKKRGGETWIWLGVVTLAMAVAGCRTKKPSPAAGLEPLQPRLEGEEGVGIPLGERFEDGYLIPGVQFENVLFAYDRYDIEPTEVKKIEAVADFLKRDRSALVLCEGHCDERGSNEYNMTLGEHRALSVRGYLIRLGIDANRIQTRSYGEERPVALGHNESAWRLNRRVEFKLYKKSP